MILPWLKNRLGKEACYGKCVIVLPGKSEIGHKFDLKQQQFLDFQI